MACTLCEERKGYQGKEHDISHCLRLERKGWQGRKGQPGKDSEESMERI